MTTTVLTRATFEAGQWFVHHTQDAASLLVYLYQFNTEGSFSSVEVRTFLRDGRNPTTDYLTVESIETDHATFRHSVGDFGMQGEFLFNEFVVASDATVAKYID